MSAKQSQVRHRATQDTATNTSGASLGLLEDVVDVCSGSDAPAVFRYIESKVKLLKQVRLLLHTIAST